jgi:hypothetical protein
VLSLSIVAEIGDGMLGRPRPGRFVGFDPPNGRL